MTPQDTAISSTNDSRTTPLSLRKNFSWTFAGNVVYAASQWGILVVMAKLGTPEMVGQFALGLAVTAPVIMFANLALRQVQATDARREYQFADYLGLRLITTVIAYQVIVGIVLVSGYTADTALVILFIGLSKSFEAMSEVFFGLLQQRERMDRIAKSLMIEGPVTLVVMGIILYLTRNVVWATVGMAIVWGLQLVLYDIRSGILILRAQSPDGRVVRLLQPRFDFSTLRRLVWLALPLGFVMMLISLNTNIPRYFIERYLGKDQLGIFAAMAYLMVAGTTVISALGQSASPKLAFYYATGSKTQFLRLLLKLVSIGVVLGVAGLTAVLIAGRVVLNLFYGPQYAAYNNVFVLVTLAAGIGFIGSFLGYAITAARYFSVQLPIYVGIACTAIAASFFLIPSYGLEGAAYVLISSAIIQVSLSLTIVLRALQRLST